MPKIKDLGINVIPETMQPPEVGGGGCGWTNCIGCTQAITVPEAGAAAAPCPQNTIVCICTALSPCIPVHTACGCTHITPQCTGPLSITGCGFPSCGFVSPCLPPTHCVGCSHIGITPSVCNQCSIGGITPTVCACSHIASVCTTGSPTVFTVTPTTPQLQPGGGLTAENIATLRNQLKQQLSALDDLEKQMGPRTAEEIDAREKQLNEELAQLKARRTELKKK